MKKNVMMAAMIALVGMLSAGLLMSWVVQANPLPYPSVPSTELPTLTVQAPKPGSPLYANNTLELNFNVTIPQSWNSDAYKMGSNWPIVGEAIVYPFLDGIMQLGPRIGNVSYNTAMENLTSQSTVIWANLTSQKHTVWIDVFCYMFAARSGTINATVSQTLTFTINSQAQTIDFSMGPVVTTRPGTQMTVIPPETVPPRISILSPATQTYNESIVPLVFTVDKTLNWLGYSLDGKQKIALTGNDTIANVTDGLHSVAVYANDTDGDLSVSTTAFIVYKPEPVPEFPTATVGAVSVAAAAAVVAAGLLVYLKKRKR